MPSTSSAPPSSARAPAEIREGFGYLNSMSDRLYNSYRQLTAAIEAGKHVLVEKPMAMNVRECNQMLSACEKNKVKLQVGYMRRFHPHHAKIKQIIDRGKLGEIVEARIQTHLWYPKQKGSWRNPGRRRGRR